MAQNRFNNSIEALVQKHSSKYFEENVIYQHGFISFMTQIGVFKKQKKLQQFENAFTKNFWLGFMAFEFTQNELDEVMEL